MAADPAARSRITLADTVAPLLLLYLILLGSILQTYGAPTSKGLLLLKLLAGTLALGLPSLYVLKRKSFRIVPILPPRVHWGFVFFSVIAGFFLLYFFLWSGTVIFPDYSTRFLAYYGDFTVSQPLFFPVAIALAVYVLSEELFFRGVVYEYVRSRFGCTAGAMLAALAFACAHLNFQIAYVILLLMLALLSTVLLEATGTFLYGFIMHATLDLSALVLAMRSIHRYFVVDVGMSTALLGVAVVACGLYLWLEMRHTAHVQTQPTTPRQRW